MRERFPSGDCALWLAQPKSIPFSDELYDLPDIGIGLKIHFQFLDALLQRAVFTKQLVDRLLHGLDLVFREPAALQPNKVEARKVSPACRARSGAPFDRQRATDRE
jgi:hypothetical protein